MRLTHDRNTAGFTIVELLIVMVIIGILAGLVITTFIGIQQKARNTAMVSGVKTYIKSLEEYHVIHSSYPVPPVGANAHDHQACFGQNYSNNLCLTEDDGPGTIAPQSWFDNSIKEVSNSLPALPKYVSWSNDGTPLIAGSFYAYTNDIGHYYLSYAGLASSEALVVFYLEGNVPNMCKGVSGDALSDVYLKGNHTNKDITVCYVPLGNFTKI